MAKKKVIGSSTPSSGANDWWNMAVGSSMLMSSIGSIATVGTGIVNTIYGLAIGGPPTSSSGGSDYNNTRFMRADQMYTRISKYPSKSTVSYAAI